MDTTNPIPQQTIVLTPTKRCPKGYRRIKGTRRCKREVSAPVLAPAKPVKAMHKSLLDVVLGVDQKKCPKGYRRIKGTRRCKREVSAPVLAPN